jgi:UDP-N-acetylglucosamine--N-acetylmuramyl-(pentapeptide) pyrophosphoryl-undecaprenol N-acetylglucosamine transferase
VTVLLPASPGGHLDELEPIAAAFSDQQRVWITMRSPRGEALERRGEQVRYLPEYGRGARAQGRLWRAALALVTRERPRLVVTTGAGATVPVCFAARARGSALFYVETSARIKAPSMTGRLVGPIATRTFVQWPELTRYYRRPLVCRPVLFDVVGDRSDEGAGSFVTVGTHSAPFRRLLDMVSTAASNGTLPTPRVIQSGVAADFTCGEADVRHYVEPAEADRLLRSARYVVCHGGAGSVAGALRAGRRPLVLPRLATHGEHYDDHQLQLVDRLADLGLVVRLSDGIRAEHLAAADAELTDAFDRSWGPALPGAVRAEAERLGVLA